MCIESFHTLVICFVYNIVQVFIMAGSFSCFMECVSHNPCYHGYSIALPTLCPNILADIRSPLSLEDKLWKGYLIHTSQDLMAGFEIQYSVQQWDIAWIRISRHFIHSITTLCDFFTCKKMS